ncbi:MAG: xylulokinase [Pseudomonadota bacterium]
MYLGIDIGTSSVKTILTDEAGNVVAAQSAPLAVSRPRDGWSEQDPDGWVDAAEQSIIALPQALRSDVKAIGLSGQMHGATLLDDRDKPLRPAILWNDNRSHAECAEIESKEPSLRAITGNKAMPGFTAPKLAWVRKHETDLFSKTRKVLLPKDYVRLVWTGDYATDLSDASGTLWLDVGARAWSDAALAVTGLSKAQMPTLHEGRHVTGELSASAAARLGLPRIPVVAGAGDQAAGAVGAGVVEPGEASLALGTSGVLFNVTHGFSPNTEEAVHAFCHALPGRWHQMAVHLSAASAVDAVARMTGFDDPASAYAAAEAHGSSDNVLFLPYLTGERTPHDDPHARGAFFGLTPETEPAALVHAALEGVAFAFADGRDALVRAGSSLDTATVVGGGARSMYWGQILAAALGMTLIYREGAETGPAEGAARLARLGVSGEDIRTVCAPGAVRSVIEPDVSLSNQYKERIAHWRALYHATKNIVQEASS